MKASDHTSPRLCSPCTHHHAIEGLDSCYCPDCKRSFAQGTAGYKEIVERCNHKWIVTWLEEGKLVNFCVICAEESLLTECHILEQWRQEASSVLAQYEQILKNCKSEGRRKDFVRAIATKKRQIAWIESALLTASSSSCSANSEHNGDNSEHNGDNSEPSCDRWNPAHFGEVPFKSEKTGQLTLEFDCDEPPDPDDFPTLQEFESAWEQWEKSNTSTSADLQPHTVTEQSEGNDQQSVVLQPHSSEHNSANSEHSLPNSEHNELGNSQPNIPNPQSPVLSNTSISNELLTGKVEPDLDRINTVSNTSISNELLTGNPNTVSNDSTSNELLTGNPEPDLDQINTVSKKRLRGEGTGRIQWRTITKNGKEYKQPWYDWQIYQKEKTLSKSAYIPKRLLKKIEQLESGKAPVVEILKLLGKTL